MKWTWLFLLAAEGWAQQPARVAPAQFDVASVKAVQPNHLVPSRITADRGRFHAQSLVISDLVAWAYDVQTAQVLDSKPELDRYDIEAKSDAARSEAELRVMLQGLLAERFHLKLHREMREMQVDRLVAGKDLKLKASTLADADPRGFTLRASDRGPAFLKAKATAMSLAWLANDLSDHLSRLVVDGTGLEGLFEFDVDFAFDRSEAADATVPVRAASNHIRESLVTALGLKLQGGKKERVEVLVIDQVQRPEPN